MAEKSDFTEQEWEALQKGVTGSAFLVAIADRSFFDSLKEAGTLAKHLATARQSNESALIKQLSDVRGTGFGLTASPSEVENETLQALREAKGALDAKAPGEAATYRQFVVEVARAVGNAASGGEAPEAEALRKIESALA